MNTYNKKWLWITEHLDSFAAKEKPVNMKEQIASTFIPGVDIWAFYRIKKFRKILGNYLVRKWTKEWNEKFRVTKKEQY